MMQQRGRFRVADEAGAYTHENVRYFNLLLFILVLL
jgi:hypothetical protein